MVETSAFAVCVILAGLTIFQLSLILGAPFGNFAWGGKHTVLPINLRIGSAISIILYGIIAIFILSQVGSINVIHNKSFLNAGIWILTAYFF